MGTWAGLSDVAHFPFLDQGSGGVACENTFSNSHTFYTFFFFLECLFYSNKKLLEHNLLQWRWGESYKVMNVKHTRYIPFPSPLFVSSLSPHPQRPCHVLWLSPMSSSYSSPSVIVFGSWPRWHPRCKDKCHGNAQRPQDLPQCVAYTTWSTNSSRSSFLVLVVGRRISLITRHHFL